jgi:hypothetical protein
MSTGNAAHLPQAFLINVQLKALLQANLPAVSDLRGIARRLGIAENQFANWGARLLSLAQQQNFNEADDVVLMGKVVEFVQRLISDRTLPTFQLQELVQQAGSLSTELLKVRPWSDERIEQAMKTYAHELGITKKRTIALMINLLQKPASTQLKRAADLDVDFHDVRYEVKKIQKILGHEENRNTPLRVRLAKQVGMPLATLMVRIGSLDEPNLGQKLISKINPSHRERVAEVLLNFVLEFDAGESLVPSGFVALNEIFFGGDPLRRGKTSGAVDSKLTQELGLLRKAFGASNAVELFQKLGFSNEQVLRLNDVGWRLAERMDPALDHFSTDEQAKRTAKGLPNTREETALRLMTARTNSSARQQLLSYRIWISIGLVSDNPWTSPADLNRAYQGVLPNSNSQTAAGNGDSSIAFRAAQVLLQTSIPRPAGAVGADPYYRRDANLLLLQAFGLGATVSGKLTSIPTHHALRDDYDSADKTPREKKNKSPDERSPGPTWQQLVPLLDRKPSR